MGQSDADSFSEKKKKKSEIDRMIIISL